MTIDVENVGPVEFPDDATSEEIGKALNERYPRPSLPAERMRLTDSQLQHYVAGGGPMAGMAAIPSLGPAAQNPMDSFITLPRVKGESLSGKAGAAVLNTAEGLVEGAASPLGVAASALGPIPKLAQGVIGAGFGIPAFKEGIHRVYEGAAFGDPQESMEGALQALTGGLITTGAAKTILGRKVPETKGALNAERKITGASGVPVEQQGIPVNRLPEVQAEAGIAQRGSQGEQAIPQPSEVSQEIASTESKVPPTAQGEPIIPMVGESVPAAERAPLPSVVAGEAKPSEALVSAAEETPVTAGESPQAITEPNVKQEVLQPRIETPQTPQALLATLPRVTVAVPEGATTIRVTDTKGRVAELTISDLNKGDNVLNGVDIASIEPGTKTRSGFKPMEGQVSVSPRAPKGIGASVRNKWATATANEPLGSESGFINLDPIREFVDKATPYVKSVFHVVRDLAKEQGNISKLDDYRKSVLDWSAKLQRSFGEAADAQKEIEAKVPYKVRREGITNWIQANGDRSVLAARATATTDPKLRKGYEAALDLTPQEIAVANDVRNTYQTLGARGQAHGVLNNFKDNYVTQVWDLGKGPATAGAKTLQEKFRFSKASTFPTFFDGEQAGYSPKTKDISKLLPVYLHEMNSVIAARQMVAQLSRGVASDGRPLVVPRGTGTQVTGPSGDATLITPKSATADTLDYKTLPNQPALNDWKWASQDQAGNPILLKSDLALHPEAYDRLKNVLGKSAIREWYSTKTSAAAQIPKLLVRGLDMANSETKRTMLGLISPFHQVQEGTHGIGHRINPFFSIPKLDLVNDAAQMDAARHGLMLAPDRASANQFMEGFRTSGLVSKIPVIGPLADQYSNYLFHDYIPGLKYKTYDAILKRNQGVYANELASGRVSLSDVKHLSAEQANAAYGHLNYSDLARNPTVQHIMQLGLLAPDFLEARARFAGQSIKGLAGQKVGREQVLALATLALAQAATAYTSSKLTGGDWDAQRPFEFRVDNRRYTMRSVPEDISTLLNDWRLFVHSRLSPLIGKGTLQYLSGVDYRGQKVSASQTTKELAQQPIPISIRGFLGIGRQSLSGWEQLASAVGLRISRYSPTTDVFDLAHKWMQNSEDPKVQKRLEIQQASVFPESEYKSLRNALNDRNDDAAKDAYSELLKTKTPNQVRSALAHPHPFTGKKSDETAFVKSLTPEQRWTYDSAVKERDDAYQRFKRMIQQ